MQDAGEDDMTQVSVTMFEVDGKVVFTLSATHHEGTPAEMAAGCIMHELLTGYFE